MTTKEAYRILEPAHFLKDKELVQPNTPDEIETRRRIIDFIKELDIARFMLAMSFKEAGTDPYLDLFEEKDFNNKFKHAYYRQHYLYSSVIWYQNSFDMILQCLWFHHKLYDKTLCKENMEKILLGCNSKTLVKRLYLGDQDNPISHFVDTNDYILDLANRLKHRQFIENDSYLLYAEAFNTRDGEYSSDETVFRIKLNDLQDSLVIFHKNLIALAKELLIPIHDSISNIFQED